MKREAWGPSIWRRCGGAGRLLAGAARRDPLLALLLLLTLLLALLEPRFPGEAPGLARPAVLATIAALMASSRLLCESNVLSRAAEEIIARAPGPRAALLLSTMLLGLASSLVTNDAGLFVAAPLAVEVALRSGLPVEGAAALAALGANIGSSLLPIGNPQNLIVWHDYGVDFTVFAARMLPLVALGYLSMVPVALALPRPRGRSPAAARERVRLRPLIGGMVSLLLVVAGAAAGHRFAGATAALAVAAVFEPGSLRGIDPAVLAILAMMMADFSFIGHLLAPHLPQDLLHSPLGTYGLALLLSQAVSNVPAAALLSLHTPHWMALAYGLNAGGVLLLQGSLANIIALRLTGAEPLRTQRLILLAGLPLAVLAALLAA